MSQIRPVFIPALSIDVDGSRVVLKVSQRKSSKYKSNSFPDSSPLPLMTREAAVVEPYNVHLI